MSSVTPITAQVIDAAKAHARGYTQGLIDAKARMEDRLNEAHSQGYEAGRESVNGLASLVCGLGAGCALTSAAWMILFIL